MTNENNKSVEIPTKVKVVFICILLLLVALSLLDIANGTTIIREIIGYIIGVIMSIFGFLLVVQGYCLAEKNWQSVWNSTPTCLFVLTVLTALIAIFTSLFGYYNELPDTYMGGVGGLAILTVIVSGVVYIPRAYKWL